MLGKAFSSAAAGIGLGAASTALNAKLQYRYAKKYALNSPSWQMAGLKDAGLNPILAAAKFGGSNNAMPIQAMDLAGSGEKMSSSTAKAATTDLTKQQKKNAEIQKDILEANVSEARSRAHSAASEANVKSNESTLHGMMTDAYIKNGSILPMIEAYKRAGAIDAAKGTVDAVNKFTRPTRTRK